MSGPAIGIRTHGGPGIGLGHVRRCLALAEALKQVQARVIFIVSADVATQALIKRQGFESVIVAEAGGPSTATLDVLVSQQIAVLITDSYEIGPDYFDAVRPHVKVLVALDDMADRHLPVDMVINAAPGAEVLPYAELTDARLLLGLTYSLLRTEFAAEPNRLILPEVEQVLITVGGSDKHNLTSRLIQWARQVLPVAQLDVVIGPFFDDQQPGTDINVAFYRDPPNMRDLMLACDLALCSGGQTTLELAATGTPALAVQLAANQAQNLTGLERAGTLKRAANMTQPALEDQVKAGLHSLACDVQQRAVMSARGRELIDGHGAERAAQAIIHLEHVKA